MTESTLFDDEDAETGWRDGEGRYGLMSRLNHWITAAVFLGALLLGLVLGYAGLSREVEAPLREWHMALGLLVLVYGVWRVLWRFTQGFPLPAAPSPRWQEITAQTVHAGLLTANLAMPVSGVLMLVAGGRALDVAGVTLLPSLGESSWLEALAEGVHEAAAPAILVLLILHVGGALKHHLIDHDQTLVRRTFGRSK